MKKITILFISLLIIPFDAASAQIQENEATPSVLSSVLDTDSKLLITEVSFKNSEADWVELYYESTSGNSLNLNGISFADDSVFKTVPDFSVNSKQYILLTFKNDMQDSPPYLYTTRSGLTGTTEQIIVYDRNGAIIDAVCWSSSKPTLSEQADMKDLFEKNGWTSSDPGACINSEEIKNNGSIVRNNFNDTGSAADWTISPSPTPAAANVYEEITAAQTDSGTANGNSQENSSGNAPVTAKQTADTKTSTVKAKTQTTAAKTTAGKTTSPAKTSTSKKTSTKTASAKASAKKYSNGNLSEDIVISELLPNPDKTDKGNEWIELYNKSDGDVNLGNWQLDDEEGGSKPFIISDKTIIKAQSTILITDKESKLALGNTGDSVRLFDFENNLTDETAYEEAPSGQSYARVPITSEEGDTKEEWLWQKKPTPDAPNPQMFQITAVITKPPETQNPYVFEATDSNKQALTVVFSEEVIPAPLAIATLTSDSKIKMTVIKNPQNYELQSYEILESEKPAQTNDFMFPSIFGSILTAGGSAIYFLRRKIKGI
jgi:hypothetical protein